MSSFNEWQGIKAFENPIKQYTAIRQLNPKVLSVRRVKYNCRQRQISDHSIIIQHFLYTKWLSIKYGAFI